MFLGMSRLGLWGLLVLGTLAFVLPNDADAKGGSKNRKQDTSCKNFVDADGDGVCDTCGGTHDKARKRQRDRDRVPTCPNFVDVDGDGVCDNCGGTGAAHRRQGR